MIEVPKREAEPKPHSESSALPRAPGAYALVVRLTRRATVTLSGERRLGLPRGRYLYAGSAYGPGGIGARVARHLRAGKRSLWHIDQLTAAAHIEAVAAIPGGDECAIVSEALGLPDAEVPIPGFGSSDCRACAAHLVRITEDLSTESVLAALALMKGAVLLRRL